MRLFSYAIWIVCLGCHAARNPYVSPLVTVDELRYHVSFLASDSLQGRASGSPGNDEAARYLAEELQSYGLMPFGDSGSFFQKFDIIAGVKAGSNNNVVFNADTFRLDHDFRPLAISASGRTEARVVFAGYGISAPDLKHDDYAGVDVIGRIVVIMNGSPDGNNPHSAFATHATLRRKIGLAAEKKTAGVIIIGRTSDDDPLIEMKYDQAGGHYPIPAISAKRALVMKLLACDEATLNQWRERIDRHETIAGAMSRDPITIATDVVYDRRETRNVAGLLKGRDGLDEYAVIGAHFDHLGWGQNGSLHRGEPAIHNGADDNASGTATMLELAQYFRHYPTRRNLIFVGFSAEEMGLLGSKYFVEHPPVELSKMITMFNFDMVGRLRDSALIVYGMGTSPRFRGLMTAGNDTIGLKLTLKDDGHGPSDYAEFYKKDIPVIAFFTNLHEDYHRPSDDADKINYDGQRKIAQLAMQVIQRVADDTARPVFTKVKNESSQPMRGFKVSLNIVPNYAYDGEGMKVDDVNPGGPAEKGGMQKGDVIIRFGGKPIRNIYDYTYALGEFKPGDRVEVIVKRGAEEVTLYVDLTKRSP